MQSKLLNKIAKKTTEFCDKNCYTADLYDDIWKKEFGRRIVEECAKVAEECIDDEWFDVGGAIREKFKEV